MKTKQLSIAFSPVNGIYGAPMGRMSVLPHPGLPDPTKLTLHKAKWVDGDYDEGGAYWGYTAGTHIYCGLGEPDVRVYVRASTAAEARERIIEECAELLATF